MVVFLLFVIACAVAPEAIINICRAVEWLVKILGIVIGSIACFWFLGYCVYGIVHRFV